jgi:ribosomal protein L32
MAVPKKRTSKAKKNARKANWKRKGYKAAQKSLSLAKSMLRLTDVAKLVDALGLGSSNFCFESSSLSIRNLLTNLKIFMLPFTLQQLRILKAVATEKNFTKAAKLLYLSQPSLVNKSERLEENLDMILINRENHKISLTENGKVFFNMQNEF